MRLPASVDHGRWPHAARFPVAEPRSSGQRYKDSLCLALIHVFNYAPQLVTMSDYKSSTYEVDIKEPIGEVHNVDTNPAAAALTAVTEANKPSLWSPGMLKLWCILGIGMHFHTSHCTLSNADRS